MDAAAELGRNPVSTRFSLSMEMSRLTRDGTAEPVSRDQILRHERGQENVHFSCSANHVQDWQPYPVDSYSCSMFDHTYMLPWYSVPVVLSPHGNARYFLGGNRPLWYILLRYSATTVMYGKFYLVYFTFLGVTPACVWCCDASTFTEHKNHQTSNLNMKCAVCVCVCVFSSHLFWTSNSLELPAGVTQDFASTFLLRCVPLFFSREGFIPYSCCVCDYTYIASKLRDTHRNPFVLDLNSKARWRWVYSLTKIPHQARQTGRRRGLLYLLYCT